MKDTKDNIQETDIVQESEELQDVIGRSCPWLSALSLIYSLLVFIGLFTAAFFIDYKGQRLIDILLEPALKYFTNLLSIT